MGTWSKPLSTVLSLRNLWVEYGDKVVLERINLEIEEGSFVCSVSNVPRRR